MLRRTHRRGVVKLDLRKRDSQTARKNAWIRFVYRRWFREDAENFLVVFEARSGPPRSQALQSYLS